MVTLPRNKVVTLLGISTKEAALKFLVSAGIIAQEKDKQQSTSDQKVKK